MDYGQVKDWLREHQERMLFDLCRFVEIPSVSGDKENVRRALDFALGLGRSMGFRAESLLDGQVGVIEAGQGDEVLGILSHVDVVSEGNRSAWRTEPFRPVIADGAVYGRGTLDDKGAIIASLYAMKAAAMSGEPFRKKVRLILGTQEEVDWADMRAYVKQYPLPDYGFTPDGEFPLCNIEKGGVDVDLVFPLTDAEGTAVPGENGADRGPRRLRLISVEAGTAQNIVPGSCSAIMEITGKKRSEALGERSENGPESGVRIVKLQTEGKAVHSCQPEKGENAILLMARKLRAIERRKEENRGALEEIQESVEQQHERVEQQHGRVEQQHGSVEQNQEEVEQNQESVEQNQLLRLLYMTEERFSDLFGKALGMESSGEYYNGEFVHRNVFSPTMFRVADKTARIHINVRYPYGTEPQTIIEGLRSLAAEYGGSLEGESVLPAVYVSRERPFLRACAEAYEEVTGDASQFVLAYGGSYAKAMPNVVSWGPIFPGEEDTCHEENEYISIHSLMANAEIFALAIGKIVFAEESFR